MNNLDARHRRHDYSPQAPLTEPPPNAEMVGSRKLVPGRVVVCRQLAPSEAALRLHFSGKPVTSKVDPTTFVNTSRLIDTDVHRVARLVIQEPRQRLRRRATPSERFRKTNA